MCAANTDGLVPVAAAVTSVFYSRPSPGEPPFVVEGEKVKEDTIVCLLEVMKCFQSIKAGVNGTIEKVLVESGTIVKKGDAVMLIRPAK